MVGDGSYLMMAQEIVTSIQEGFKLTIVLCDSHGYASIGALSRVGRLGRIRYRTIAIAIAKTGALAGEPPAGRSGDQRRIARRPRSSRHRSRVARRGAGRGAKCRAHDRRSYVPVDPAIGVPGYESWWDVAVAEVSEQESVREARKEWGKGKKTRALLLVARHPWHPGTLGTPAPSAPRAP